GCSELYQIFFFQAEDGIRDFHVTGVQTCALPICELGGVPLAGSGAFTAPLLESLAAAVASPGAIDAPALLVDLGPLRAVTLDLRSEERRVGEERGEREWHCTNRTREAGSRRHAQH